MRRTEKFESPLNEAIEENARMFLCGKYPDYQFMPLAAGAWTVDWCVYSREKLHGFGEFRRRFVSCNQYPDFRFSAAKWAKLVDLEKTFNVPSAFYLQYNDALCVIKGLDDGITKQFVPFGRARMRDSMDAEPSVIIPREKIQVIHLGCVSDSLTKRPTGRSCDGDVESIRSFGLDYRGGMGFSE